MEFRIEPTSNGKVKVWKGMTYVVVSLTDAQEAATNPAAAAKLLARLS